MTIVCQNVFGFFVGTMKSSRRQYIFALTVLVQFQNKACCTFKGTRTCTWLCKEDILDCFGNWIQPSHRDAKTTVLSPSHPWTTKRSMSMYLNKSYFAHDSGKHSDITFLYLATRCACLQNIFCVCVTVKCTYSAWFCLFHTTAKLWGIKYKTVHIISTNHSSSSCEVLCWGRATCKLGCLD